MRAVIENVLLCEKCVNSTIEDFCKNRLDALDDYLDGRDSGPFDEDWVIAYEDVEEKKDGLSQEDRGKLKEASSKLREKVFKFAIGISGSSDFASAVSDDAGLIAEAMALQISNFWINALGNEYFSRRLPEGELTPQDENKIKSSHRDN